MAERLRIMGIDPGTNYMGYGIIEIEGNVPHAVVIGEIDMHRIKDPYEKLRYIFDRVRALVEEYRPSEVAFESPFFGENVQSMLKLGRAQGVAIAAALSLQVGITEYAPMRIKQAITGRGSASKEQVAQMINSILHTDYRPRKLDATDALPLLYHGQPHNAGYGRRAAQGAGRRPESASRQSFVGELRAEQPRQSKRLNNIHNH